MIPIPMKASQNGIHLTEQFEGCKLIPYQDPGGVWTDGYGNTHGVVPGVAKTQVQAEADLIANYQNSQNDVNQLVNVQLTQGEFDALCDFDFNLGRGRLAGSTLLKLVNESKFADAANEFEKWKFDAGKILAGLLRRRIAEKIEFLS